MTYAENGYMPLNRQLFRRSLAETLSELLRQKYGSAKAIARGIGIDPATAENLRKGHLGVRTLELAIIAEGRDLWNRLGDELFGETFYQFEERRIEAALKEAESVRSNLVRMRAQSEELLARAGLMDAPVVGRASDAQRREEGGAGRPADKTLGGQTDAARDNPAKVEARSFAPKRGAR